LWTAASGFVDLGTLGGRDSLAHAINNRGNCSRRSRRTGKDEIVIDFGPALGLWQYPNDTTWSQLHTCPRS
jgi:hypothetical protein